MRQNLHITAIENRIGDLRKKILSHKLYNHLDSIPQLNIFMQAHVFAVWDFMSLLKGLQIQLTSVSEAWVPTSNKKARRLVNEIVVAEESDIDVFGQPASHYELYLDAMHQSGANTRPVTHFIHTLTRKFKLNEILRFNLAELEPFILEYLKSNYAIIKRGKIHEMAAAFTFGREELIPEMFTEIVRELDQKMPGQLDALLYYLNRHIELDGDEHGPMAIQMIVELCGSDEQKWIEAEDTAIEALTARLKLWDGIATQLSQVPLPQTI